MPPPTNPANAKERPCLDCAETGLSDPYSICPRCKGYGFLRKPRTTTSAQKPSKSRQKPEREVSERDFDRWLAAHNAAERREEKEWASTLGDAPAKKSELWYDARGVLWGDGTRLTPACSTGRRRGR